MLAIWLLLKFFFDLLGAFGLLIFRYLLPLPFLDKVRLKEWDLLTDFELEADFVAELFFLLIYFPEDFFITFAFELFFFEEWLDLLVGEMDSDPRLLLFVNLLSGLGNSLETDIDLERLRFLLESLFVRSSSLIKLPAIDFCCCCKRSWCTCSVLMDVPSRPETRLLYCAFFL